MANFGTVVQNIVRVLHLDAETVGSLATADVKKEIIDTMDYFSTEAPWFLVEDLRIYLESGVEKYNLGDFLESISPRVRYIPDTTATSEVRYPIEFVTYDTLRNNLDFSAELGSSTVTGSFPRRVAVEPGTNFLFVAPKPSATNSAIELKVTRQKAIPSYVYSAGSWIFYEPEGVQTLGDDFENFWLKYAQKLIEYRSIAQLLIGPYGGSEMADNKAAIYKRLEGAELVRLRTRTGRKAPAYTVPKAI